MRTLNVMFLNATEGTSYKQSQNIFLIKYIKNLKNYKNIGEFFKLGT